MPRKLNAGSAYAAATMDILPPEILAELLGRVGVADRLAFTATCRAARALRALKSLVWGPLERREMGRSLLIHGRFLVKEKGEDAVLEAHGLDKPGETAHVHLDHDFRSTYGCVVEMQNLFVVDEKDTGETLAFLDGAGGKWLRLAASRPPLSGCSGGWFERGVSLRRDQAPRRERGLARA